MADAVKRGRIALVREVRELLGKVLALKSYFSGERIWSRSSKTQGAPDSTGMISAPNVSRFPGMPCKAGRFADFIFRNRQTGDSSGERGKQCITKEF